MRAGSFSALMRAPLYIAAPKSKPKQKPRGNSQQPKVTVDVTKRRRRGPVPLAASDKRSHTVSVRLSIVELALLDSQRASVRMQRGEYLRAAALDKLPSSIPEVNRDAWVELGHAAANLNQIARYLNSNGNTVDASVLADTRNTVDAFRRLLIGCAHES